MRDPDPHELVELLMLSATNEQSGGAVDASGSVNALVAAALLAASSDGLLDEALRLARSTGDRQLVTIAAAYLAGDHERVDALARDHLLDHPSKPVLAWIVAHSRSAATNPAQEPRTDNPSRSTP
jgi:hypothetical protein